MFGFGKSGKKSGKGSASKGMTLAAMMSMFGGGRGFGRGTHSGNKPCNNPECKKKTISASYCSLKCAVLHKRACGGIDMTTA